MKIFNLPCCKKKKNSMFCSKHRSQKSLFTYIKSPSSQKNTVLYSFSISAQLRNKQSMYGLQKQRQQKSLVRVRAGPFLSRSQHLINMCIALPLSFSLPLKLLVLSFEKPKLKSQKKKKKKQKERKSQKNHKGNLKEPFHKIVKITPFKNIFFIINKIIFYHIFVTIYNII